MPLKLVRRISRLLLLVFCLLYFFFFVTRIPLLGYLSVIALIVMFIFGFTFWKCPHCGKLLTHVNPKFCPDCGTKIDLE